MELGTNNVEDNTATPVTQNIESMETTSETSSTSTSTSTLVAEDTNETTEAVETTDTFTLRFSLVCRPFKLPGYPEVALEATRFFQDPQISVTNRQEGSELVYKFELNEQKPKYGNSLSFVVEGQKYNIDLLPYEEEEEEYRPRYSYGGNNRENNLLLTFMYAGQRKYKNISMEYFDNLIQKDLGLTLEKATEKQKIKGTQIFNGNRYCVVRKPENLAVIPDFVPVQDHIKKKTYRIRISYDGKIYNCGRCNGQHGRRCPQLTEFYAAKEERERMERNNEIKTKIISDSTLRNVDRLGLCADVMTMSGGGLGQVVQSAIDDPDTRDKSNVILLGGANDIKNSKFDNDKEFAQNVSATIAKIHEYASNVPEKKITLVNSHPRSTDNNFINNEENVERMTRVNYLHTKLKEEIEKMPSLEPPIQNVDIIDVEYDVDESGHPTIEGTLEILHTLNDFLLLEKKLIWHNDYIVTEKKYRGVQAIFKYGCNHCYGFGQAIQHTKHRNSIVCDDCMDMLRHNAQIGDCTLIDNIREEVTKKLADPPLNRALSDDEEENARTKKRQCLNEQPNIQNEDQDVEMPQQS